MGVWDGNKRDTTNYKTERYMQINSCGFQRMPAYWTVIREKGRYDYHLLLVDSGELEVCCGNNTKILRKGNFVIYEPSEKQYYESKTAVSSHWMHFGGTVAEEILSSYGLRSGIYLTDYSINAFEAYSTLIRQFNQPNLKMLANGTLLILLAHISAAVNNIRHPKISDAMSEIITYINMNYNKQLTIEELSQRAGYSKSRFLHLFKELMNTTPLAYRNNIRLTNACELLSGSGQSIGNIALSCGFEDQLYFCRVFKKRYGISPGEYRRQTVTEQLADV